LLTPRQAAKVDALKSASPDFTAMLRLAMRFRGILRSKDIQNLAPGSMTRNNRDSTPCSAFIRTVRRDVDAVTNALTEGWSNGQTEGGSIV
jgi:transposase